MVGFKEYQTGDEYRPEFADPGKELPPPELSAMREPGPCPITILGSERGLYSFLTPRGEIRTYNASAMLMRSTLIDLFDSREDWLWSRFKIVADSGAVKPWNPEKVGAWLVRESARLPIFNADGRMRGAGSWLEEGDEDTPDHVILHCGDALFVNLPDERGGGWKKPGRHGKFIYPTLQPEARPGARGSTKDEAARYLDILKTWSWTRPDIDPIILFGWICAAPLCGALEWRPGIWITGDRETGKTTLQDLISRTIGDGLLHLQNPTEASIRQALNGAAKPVELDEFEPDSTGNAANVVKLIRYASSRKGGRIPRGGADGRVIYYSVHAAFLCTSILRPPLAPADMQRFSMLELGPVTVSAETSMKVDAAIRLFSGFSQRFTRRVLDRWDDYRTSYATFNEALRRSGHAARSASQYATLFALADVVLNDQIATPSDVEAWTDKVDVIEIAEQTGDESDSEQCLHFLMTSAAPVTTGNKSTPIFQMVRNAILDPSSADHYMMQSFGLRIMSPGSSEGISDWCLAVARSNKMLADIFTGSRWDANKTGAKASGGDGKGSWDMALKRLPGAYWRAKHTRMNGARHRTINIPLFVLDLDVTPKDASVVISDDDDPMALK